MAPRMLRGHALLKALVAALAFSAVLPRSAAASLRVLQEEAPELLQAAAPAASPGAAPSPAPLPSYERLPPGNMTARNIFQDAWEVFESMGEQALDWAFGDICVYGQNCGQNCVSDSYDVGDDLDHACYVHDRCLDPNSEYAKERCECHRDLQDAAEEIASRDECSWWEFWCSESEMVATAPSISAGMEAVKVVDGC